ncbi:TPR domain-containing protein [Acrodontium crateriforme]|uniref:TPR domain-containing protein n=1 Tax=Acrodontium crateriforme TaxID=150365 RepID=A0AAQ3R6U4_9PEZI|nr:TPR domain-containing protein [Acrodontium crateriforme]
MADALLTYLRQSLPEEVANLAEPYVAQLETGDFNGLLQSPEAQSLLGHVTDARIKTNDADALPTWSDFIFRRLGDLLADRSHPELQVVVFCIGYAALLAFVQSNITGPPLPFSSAKTVLPKIVADDKKQTQHVRQSLRASVSVDGIAAYKLTPNIELLCLADAIMTCPPILKNIKAARWAKMRVVFMQQRLLSEVSSTLQNNIYDDLDALDDAIMGTKASKGLDSQIQAEYLLEKATIHVHHGLDKFAREDLEKAKTIRSFEFAVIGLLGKRTKFQQKDISQLVVLARSAKGSEDAATESNNIEKKVEVKSTASQPTKLNLNDDTLLESISFTDKSLHNIKVQDESSLPSSLASLDPSDQPQLDAVDSTILLSLASAITNTSPEDGLTREETLPYATRVLEGGSSNWQVYTQALLVRSRIEGYKSRTVERGLLQLQALVDQVIADTADSEAEPLKDGDGEVASTSFLPRAKEQDSAPVTERLRYVFQLASPTRWDLEAELATRWVQLGGLRSALEIYERLEMWAEAALCWAATDREDKAVKMVRRMLFHATNGGPNKAEDETGEDEKWEGPARDPAPLDAPRLYCILGDIDQSKEMYEKAWEVSKSRYARAQRSVGRLCLAERDYIGAAAAYSKALQVNRLNHSSWFSFGCSLLELAQYERAAEAFSTCVSLESEDAESWSNLAAALLRIEPASSTETETQAPEPAEDEDESVATERFKPSKNPKQNRADALTALKRAAALKHESFRIWQNVLIVAASVSPPDYASILTAQRNIITLRGATEGEACIDTEILTRFAQHIISSNETYDPAQPGITRIFVKLIDESVIPLITGSADLWRLVSRLALWRNKPSSALDAEEKAWRAITTQPGWETETEKRWDAVVEATVRLCDSYESLGPKARTEGMGAGEVVAKDWKFKARSAVRGILGRGKGSWEGTHGWERLKEVAEGLKG